VALQFGKLGFSLLSRCNELLTNGDNPLASKRGVRLGCPLSASDRFDEWCGVRFELGQCGLMFRHAHAKGLPDLRVYLRSR
jgi:hypothetical protein